MKALIISGLLALTGCATPMIYVDDQGNVASQRVRLECDLEARRAVVGVANTIEAAFLAAQFESQCLAVKGYRRVEVKK